MIDINEFRSPSAIFRSHPFWSWNDDLKADELRRQIRDFKKAGMGGFFMHSRIGLITTYMGKEWMDVVKASIDEAKKQGMYAHLYDEDRWPSGFGGGMVPAKDKNYANKYMIYSDKELKGVGFTLLKKENIKGKDAYFYARLVPQGHIGFNHTSYVDLMKKEVTEEFLKSTHEAYKKEISKEFGKTVPSMFTDEPFYGTSNGWYENFKLAMPWTDKMFAEFKKRRGYAVEPKIGSLFFEVKGFEKVRHDYLRTALELFLENFTKLVGDWCAKNKLNYTGHYLSEDDFHNQIRVIGAAMPHYEYMQWPGIDHLGWNIGDTFGMQHLRPHVTCKQVASVSHQFNKQRVLSELYGVAGWNLTFEGQKWIGDFEYALGINLRCQHLSLYSLKGCRKRDYPASINYQQAWFKDYALVEDYFGRLSYMLTRGEFKADILVMHPISSAWCGFSWTTDKKKFKYNEEFTDWGDVEKNNKYFEPFIALSRTLSGLHRDYDYGDETIMAKHGRIKGSEFIINKMKYKLVIVPPSLSWFKSTLSLLKKFVAENGKVIAIKPLPVAVEGADSKEIEAFFKSGKALVVDDNKEQLEKALDLMLERDVSVKDANGKEIDDIYCQHRQDGRKHIYFFSNKSLVKSYKANIDLCREGYIEEWDLHDGSFKKVPSMEIEIAPAGSRLLVLDEDRPAFYMGIKKPAEKIGEIKFAKSWSFKRKDHNALTLDYCSYRIGENKWSKVLPVWKAQVAVRDHFHTNDSYLYKLNGMEPQWLAKDKVKRHEKDPLQLKYTFKVKQTGNKVLLALETPERFEVFVNGKQFRCPATGENWWVDKSFRTIEITRAVKKGTNEVLLISGFATDMEMESVYIIGDFGVYTKDERNLVIDKESKVLQSGDYRRQGYYMYGGPMVYKQDIKVKKAIGNKYFLEMAKFDAVLMKVRVNGNKAGAIWHAPYKLDITDLLKDGSNKIEIEVIISLRNLLGPHHLGNDKIWDWHGPTEFVDEKRWTDKYVTVAYGLSKSTKIIEYR